MKFGDINRKPFLIFILYIVGCRTVLCNGFIYLFWRDKWNWTKSTQMSYALQAVKQKNL